MQEKQGWIGLKKTKEAFCLVEVIGTMGCSEKDDDGTSKASVISRTFHGPSRFRVIAMPHPATAAPSLCPVDGTSHY